MKIAIAAATALEWQGMGFDGETEILPPGPHQIARWTTGIGMLHAAHELTARLWEERPDLVIQTGIAGAFDTRRHPLGTACCIARDSQADLGVLEVDGWKDVFQMGLAGPSDHPYQMGWLVNPHTALTERCGLPKASGVTVNRVGTEPAWIEGLLRRLEPDVETMEGAALHYTCLRGSVPFLQIRGISNRVGERDKSAWRIGEALRSAWTAVQQLTERLPENGIS